MALVWIPALLRELTEGQANLTVPGKTVREVVDNLAVVYPEIKARLCQGDALLPSLTVFVDGTRAPLGLSQSVKEQSEIHFLPLIKGG